MIRQTVFFFVVFGEAISTNMTRKEIFSLLIYFLSCSVKMYIAPGTGLLFLLLVMMTVLIQKQKIYKKKKREETTTTIDYRLW